MLLGACGDDGGAIPTPDAGPDVGVDAGPPEPLATDHCTYAPLPATARAGGTVTAGAVRVGLAERALALPIGVALGGNTSRAAPLDAKGAIDARQVPLSGSFTPSVGIESTPMVKAIAITAGDETVVLLRTDTIFSDDTITHEVTARLGPAFAGKVLWSSSHTHTAPGSYSADSKLQIGAGPIRARIRDALIARMVETAQAALAAQVPAKIGIATNEAFDLENRVSYDRRSENDFLTGDAARKDQRLALIRIDGMDDRPLAVLPIFGVHSAILDDGVSVFSTDASGAFERAIEEQFDFPVMAVHLQGAAGDVLGESRGHLDYDSDSDPRWDFARNEECARYALPQFMEAWTRAGADMKSELEMEMVTRSVTMGPDWRAFTVRGGALSYAPWDGRRRADREVYGDDGAILSPIDEFNAPAGAGLCGGEEALLTFARLPNVAGLTAYNSCANIPDATSALGGLLGFSFEEMPLCNTTRATISVLRLGDYLFPTAPGEPVVPWRDRVAAESPFPVERTFVLGLRAGSRRLHPHRRGLAARRLRADHQHLGPARGRAARRAARRPDAARGVADARGRRAGGRGSRRRADVQRPRRAAARPGAARRDRARRGARGDLLPQRRTPDTRAARRDDPARGGRRALRVDRRRSALGHAARAARA